jgi:hypothetical protein
MHADSFGGNRNECNANPGKFHEEEITCTQQDKCCQQFFILYNVDDVADNDW